ncbi:hypothetical protein EVAR_99485_1 [Eumeta japonica]|uniref:Uncharacterized protein n=1 Tax=Eumeta variegata TaxID=151549 RepID=A0A4C2AC04_EUMVA|nr:hypothetical protein EVAR_99485_1 [Eumeta japonica]
MNAGCKHEKALLIVVPPELYASESAQRAISSTHRPMRLSRRETVRTQPTLELFCQLILRRSPNAEALIRHESPDWRAKRRITYAQ